MTLTQKLLAIAAIDHVPYVENKNRVGKDSPATSSDKDFSA